MYTTIYDPIEVNVRFTTHSPKPLSFIWKGRSYRIDKINFVHDSHKGNSRLFHFSVSSGDEVYKLTLNTTNLNWKLDEIYSNQVFSQSQSLNEPNSTYRLR